MQYPHFQHSLSPPAPPLPPSTPLPSIPFFLSLHLHLSLFPYSSPFIFLSLSLPSLPLLPYVLFPSLSPSHLYPGGISPACRVLLSPWGSACSCHRLHEELSRKRLTAPPLTTHPASRYRTVNICTSEPYFCFLNQLL
jgi:hypothetical protein